MTVEYLDAKRVQGSSTADGALGSGLKAYYKFDESSGNIVNVASTITGNSTIGTGANIVFAGTGTATYGVTGTPTNLGNAVTLPQTTTSSGIYGTFGDSTTDFDFMWSGTPKWTMCFWAKQSASAVSNTTLIKNNNGEGTKGFEIYWYGTSTVKLRFNMTNGDAGNPAGRPFNSADFADFSTDGNWHFYSYVMDGSLGSNQLKVTRDGGTTENFSKTAGGFASSGTSYSKMTLRTTYASIGSYVPPEQSFCELMIFDTVLTDAQLTRIYNAGAGRLLSNAGTTDEKATLVTASSTIDNGLTDIDGSQDSTGADGGFVVQSGSSLIGLELNSITMRIGRNNSGGHPATKFNMELTNSSETEKATYQSDVNMSALAVESSATDVVFTYLSGSDKTIASGDKLMIKSQSGYPNATDKLYFSKTDLSGATDITKGFTNGGGELAYSWCANFSQIASSNLPENTIFNETDTRYQYWLQSGKWQPTTMYGTDFTSSTGWTFNDSNKMSIDTTNGTLDFEPERDLSNDAGAYDLGKVITAEKWRIRFKWKFTKNIASGGDVGAGNGFYVGLSDKTQASGQNTSQDFIGLQMYRDNQDTFGGIDCDGATVPRIYDGEDEQDVDIGGTATTYYNEISRTGASTYTVKMWTDSYNGTSMGTASCTCSSSIAGLRYIKIFNEDVQSIGTSTDIAIEVFDLEFAQG